MKNKPTIYKKWLIASVISLFTPSTLVMSATFDPLEFQKDDSTGIDQITPLNNEFKSSPSFLNSLRQAEVTKRKTNYNEILNLLKKNKLEEAKNKLSKLLKEYPNESEFYNLQALLSTINKDTVGAQQAFQKAIELDSKNINARLGLAKLALDNSELDKVKDYANQILSINDKTIKAYILLANIASKQKNNNEVERVLLEAHEKIRGNIKEEIEVLNNLGQFYTTQKQPEKILLISEELAKRYPNHSAALSVLAGAQIINNKKPEAEATLLQLINQEKQDIKNRLLLARLLSEHPDKDKEVLALLDETALISPDKPEALAFKTVYLIKLKRNQEALKLSTQIDKQFPKLTTGKQLKGAVYRAENNLDKAYDMYQQAYKIQPDNKTLANLVGIMNAQGKQPDAINLLNNALEKNNKDIFINFELAKAYQLQNNIEKAEAHYKAVLNEQPDNPLALNNLADLYSRQNNPQALELAKKAYDKAPESAAILDTYGYILIKQSQAKEGLPILEKALSLAPKNNGIQFHLAEAYSANGNNKKAIELLEVMIKVKQDFPEKKAAVSLLNKLKN